MMLRMENCQSRVADVNAGQTVVDACERANILAAGAIRRPLRDSLLTAARVPLPLGRPGCRMCAGAGRHGGTTPLLRSAPAHLSMRVSASALVIGSLLPARHVPERLLSHIPRPVLPTAA